MAIPLFIPAILLQLLSTSLNYIGMTLQKKAADSLPAIRSEIPFGKAIKNFLTNKAWIFGYVLNIISVLVSTVALGLASLSLVQPFYGFGLIVLAIFAHFYLKEEITKVDVIGIFFGIIGIVVIGISAEAHELLSFYQLYTKLVALKGVIFLSVCYGIAIISFLISEWARPTVSIIFLSLSSSIWTASAFLFSKAVAAVIRDAGLIGALFGSSWYFLWSLVGLYILVTAIGLVTLNIAYQNGHSVIVIPIWTSVQIILPLLAGIIIFEEWLIYTKTGIILQTIGIFVMLVSIIILSISNGRKEDQLKQLITTAKISQSE